MGLHNEKTERRDIEEATLLREVRNIIDQVSKRRASDIKELFKSYRRVSLSANSSMSTSVGLQSQEIGKEAQTHRIALSNECECAN